MKRNLMLSAAFCGALALAACGERNEPVEDGPVEQASAQSGVGSNPASNAVQDATSGAVGMASAATLGRTTAGFVGGAAIGDMFEIQSAQVAQEKSQNAQVKEFAQMLITDHQKMTAELKTAANGVQDATIPTAMDERRQGMIDNLRQAPADQFDRVFLAQQVAAHQENLTLHQAYAENGENATLKAHAAKGAPMIQQHLDRARQLEGAVGGGGNAGAGNAGGGNAGGASSASGH